MKDQNGFTLIEVIVILVIIGIGMTAGIAGYTTQVRISQLKRDADRIIDDLDRARQLTIARDTRGAYCLTHSYSMEFTGATGNYTLKHTCETNPANFTTTIVTTTKLESTLFPASSTINFSEPYGEIPADSTLIVKHPSLEKCIEIIIRVAGPVSISDPQACP